LAIGVVLRGDEERKIAVIRAVPGDQVVVSVQPEHLAALRLGHRFVVQSQIVKALEIVETIGVHSHNLSGGVNERWSG
jgi:hypothetical protein